VPLQSVDLNECAAARDVARGVDPPRLVRCNSRGDAGELRTVERAVRPYRALQRDQPIAQPGVDAGGDEPL
jgi:hypothetical protein